MVNDNMRYKEPIPISKKEAERAFGNGKDNEICDALVNSAYHISDWEWVLNWVSHFLNGKYSEDVKAIAITAVGHIARIHGKTDMVHIVPVLQKLRLSARFEGLVEDTLNDIEIYCRYKPKK